jgi:hypothetical protein
MIGAKTLAGSFQEAGHPANRLTQIIDVRQEHNPEMVRIGPVEASKCKKKS